MRTIGDIMSRDVASVGEDAAMPQIIEFFERRAFSGAPVVDADGRVVGLISKSDLALRRSKNSENFSALKAGDVMTPFLFDLGPEASLLKLIETMDEYKIHRVVITEEERPVGIVTTMDLVRDYGKLLAST